MDNLNWKLYYKGITDVVKLKSKDVNTKIGAVIVGQDNEIISTGYNSFPRGINDSMIERQERPEKYYWFVHAELNSILNAARVGVSTKNSTIYVSCGLPCANCAMAIINSGIKKIVCHGDLETSTGAKGAHWEEHAKRSLTMLQEAGIEIEFYD